MGDVKTIEGVCLLKIDLLQIVGFNFTVKLSMALDSANSILFVVSWSNRTITIKMLYIILYYDIILYNLSREV